MWYNYRVMNMMVGVCVLTIRIYESNSLKDKRSVVKSLIQKLEHKFNISICESGENDNIHFAEVGFAAVSNNKKLVDSTIDRVIDFAEAHERCEVVNIYREVY